MSCASIRLLFLESVYTTSRSAVFSSHSLSAFDRPFSRSDSDEQKSRRRQSFDEYAADGFMVDSGAIVARTSSDPTGEVVRSTTCTTSTTTIMSKFFLKIHFESLSLMRTSHHR
jgi:hypothetical protein